jgi:predicted enzyme related to lactoylglutathione lyase
VAFVTDPWGNAFELYNYQPQRGTQPVRIANVDLYVTDLERAAAFYQKVFGLYIYPNDRLGSNGATIKQLTGTSPTDTSGSERVLSFSPDHMEGVVVMSAGAALGHDPSYRYSVITVGDLGDVLRTASASGGRVVRKPHRDDTGHLAARLTDPDGNLLELREAPAPERLP